MDDKQWSRVLADIAREEVGEDMDLWPGIERQVRTHSRGALRAPRTRAGRALLVAAAMIVGVVGVYAWGVARQPGDPGLEAADEAGLVAHLDLTQTIDDFTVSLDTAYADANRISIQATASGRTTADRVIANFSILDARLTDDQGREYAIVFGGGGGGGGGGGSGPAAEQVVEFSSTVTLSYDASAIDDAPDEVNLHLEITVGTVPVPPGMPPAPMPGTTPFETVEMPPLGPFAFDFTLPFNPGVVLPGPYAAEAGGRAMTLREVVITPSMSRLTLCFAPPTEPVVPPVAWMPDLTVTAGDETLVSGELLVFSRALETPAGEAPCGLFTLPEALDPARAGFWTWSVDRLRIPGSADPAALVAALADEGIAAEVLPDGGFMLEQDPEAMADPAYWETVETVQKRLEVQLDGPWVFTVEIPS